MEYKPNEMSIEDYKHRFLRPAKIGNREVMYVVLESNILSRSPVFFEVDKIENNKVYLARK